MPSQGDPTAQTLLGHLTDRAGAHAAADLTVDERGLGDDLDAALASQFAPSPAVDGDVADVLAIASLSPLVTEWVPQSGGGGGVTLEQVQDDLGNTSLVAGAGITKTYNDGAGTITIAVTGNTYQPIDSDLTTIAAANNASVLAATTASFTTADETKLDGIEAGADVTDTTNVTAAGALMDSEVDADIKTLSLPANTTISAFGATLVDDADASAVRSTLGLVIGTNVQAYDADLADIAGIADAQGDIIVRGASGWERLAKSATSTDVLTAGASQPAWAAAPGGSSGQQAIVREGNTQWHQSPYITGATGTAWPIINRTYYTPFYFATSVEISAIALNVTVGGTASNVVRLGLYSSSSTTRMPATILAQGTVAGDSTGTKTLTLGTAQTVSGLVWVASCPQGSTSPGSTWMATSVPVGQLPLIGETAASWAGTYPINISWFFAESGTFADNPTLSVDSASRVPVVAVRIT